jgi:hypothetical protein
MIEVEGNINEQPISILIDSGDGHSYLDPRWWKYSLYREARLENYGW